MNDATQGSDAPEEPFGVHQEEPGPGSVAPTDNERLMACLSYASQFILPAVLPVILLLSEESRRSAFVRYHAVHSLALLVAAVAYEVVAVVVYVLGSALTGCLACVLWALFLAPLAAFGYYAVVAFQGKSPEVPYLTKFLRDSNWL